MAGGIINTGTHPKLLWPGLHAIWGQVFNEHPPEYTDLYDIETSTQAYEEDVQVTGFGLAPTKPEASSATYDSEVQGPVSRYQHVAYALGYIVSYEELQDNLYEKVGTRRAKANAFSMDQTIEYFGALPYNKAFTAGVTYADGSTLVATDHTMTTGGTQSNRLSPDADLSEASIEDLTIQMMGITTDRGLLISLIPQSLHVARQEWYNANRIMRSVLQPDSGSNNLNILKAENVFPRGIKMNHYFTSAHAWFIRSNAMNGMTFFWREKPRFQQDNDFDTMNAKAFSYMRFSCGGTDTLRAVFGSNGP